MRIVSKIEGVEEDLKPRSKHAPICIQDALRYLGCDTVAEEVLLQYRILVRKHVFEHVEDLEWRNEEVRQKVASPRARSEKIRQDPTRPAEKNQYAR